MKAEWSGFLVLIIPHYKEKATTICEQRTKTIKVLRWRGG
ncbi:hypothetical protein BACCAP_00515 [Pseudoflavonifractor capillosus ATCC 29799]|uniref:Uncharacterized protein n=1 Tax=Pseudoflavonifractor capillosus ATCC 29799 TaxID=411467 RepID=A6NQP4_9FIRM|nr:hypothetical protein BACCAP_00515 [Pseudoflavonifractor capillosus ATCC 29799]